MEFQLIDLFARFPRPSSYLNVSDLIQFDHNDDERIMMRMMNLMMMMVVMSVKVHHKGS